MKFIVPFFFACISLQFASAQFSYINPKPGTDLHHPKVTITLKNGALIDRTSISDHQLAEVKGSMSGKHTWTAQLSDDDKTIIIKPDVPFEYNETVTVTVHPKLRKLTGEMVEGTTFQFSIRAKTTVEQEERIREFRRQNFIEEYGYDPSQKNPEKVVYPLDSMPSFTININNNPAPGRIFYTNHEDQTGPSAGTNSFTTIIDNDGTIFWARDTGPDGRDFKLNENGYLSYFIRARGIWMILDSNYYIIDSVQCKNGYELSTNDHDVMMYADGHFLLMAYDIIETDMTAYGGLPNALVQHFVVQELDAARNVVFEWRSDDHFEFTDANQYTPLTNMTVDYIHGNSLERDFDGNILISSRNFDELSKLNSETGEVMWRMGGENNQFTFVNDNNEKHFASQHDLRRIPNGNITIFNNGNKMTPQVSSAKEYALDEVNKVATLVWYYEHPDVNGVKVYGPATGNAQRLPNGNTMIDWGLVPFGVPNHTEVDQNKNIVWEMTFDTIGQKSYRVHKYQWDPCSRISAHTMKATPKPAKTTLAWGPATGAKKYKLQYRPLGAGNWITAPALTKNKVQLTGLMPSTSYEWKVQTLCAFSPAKTSAMSAIDTFTTPPQKLSDAALLTEELVTLYPVPASDILHIAFNQPLAARFSIMNMLGMIMYSGNLDGKENQVIPVSIDQWPSGIYLLKIVGESQPDKLFRFVKE